MRNLIKFSKILVAVVTVCAMLCTVAPVVFADAPTIASITVGDTVYDSSSNWGDPELTEVMMDCAELTTVTLNASGLQNVTIFSYENGADSFNNENIQIIAQKDGGDTVEITFRPRVTLSLDKVYVAKIGATGLSTPVEFYYTVKNSNIISVNGSNKYIHGSKAYVDYDVTYKGETAPDDYALVVDGQELMLQDGMVEWIPVTDGQEITSYTFRLKNLNWVTAFDIPGTYSINLKIDGVLCQSNATLEVPEGGVCINYSIGDTVYYVPVESNTGVAEFNLVPNEIIKQDEQDEKQYFLGWATTATVYKDAEKTQDFKGTVYADYYSSSWGDTVAPTKGTQTAYVDCTTPDVEFTALWADEENINKADSEEDVNDIVSHAKAQYVLRKEHDYLRFVAIIGDGAIKNGEFEEAGFVLSTKAAKPTKEAFMQYSAHKDADGNYWPGANAYKKIWQKYSDQEGNVLDVTSLNDSAKFFKTSTPEGIIFAEVQMKSDAQKDTKYYATPYAVVNGVVYYGATKAASYNECLAH